MIRNLWHGVAALARRVGHGLLLVVAWLLAIAPWLLGLLAGFTVRLARLFWATVRAGYKRGVGA